MASKSPVRSLISTLLVVATLSQPAATFAADQATGPEKPKGYKNADEVKMAILTGQVKLITNVTETPEGIVEENNIQYGTTPEKALLLDMARPKVTNKKGPVPALLFIHGGGWKSGSRDVYRYYTTKYAQLGYVCVTMAYRLSGEAPFPAAVQDAKCAVRWLRSNAAKYNIDPNKIAAIGGSAGGHLSMMLGYAQGEKEFEGSGGNPDASSAVQLVVNYYGPYDLTTPFAQKAGVVKSFLGNKSYQEAPELYAKASPSTFLKKSAPPTLIFQGTIDDTVPVEQADMLAKRLKELGVPYRYERLEGWPHTMDLAEPVNIYCRSVLTEFLSQHFPLPK